MKSPLLLAFPLLVACSANSSGSPLGASDAAVDDTSTGNGGRAPFTSCRIDLADASSSRTSALCATNPALDGCHMCIGLSDIDAGDDNNVCVFACRIGMSDCPAGQTCLPQQDLGRDTQGSCRTFGSPSTLGYCR